MKLLYYASYIPRTRKKIISSITKIKYKFTKIIFLIIIYLVIFALFYISTYIILF